MMFQEKNNAPNQTVKNVTTAGTAEPLSATSQVVKRLMIQARNNTGNIYRGDSNVSSSSYAEVAPALNSFTVLHDVDLAEVYIDADNDGEGVTYSFELY